ncbi:MAG: hypothetical protein HOC18_06395 [Candidatus Marinimicrobia bacterium]|jgi:hypothetical protein|nr:hypothetical protein [Candidatus Neomarinimicrobiota bacterium]
MDINNIRGKEWDSINKAVSDVVLGKQQQEEQKIVEEPQDTTEEPQDLQEGSKEEYEKFFQSALKKFGVKSPAELEDDKKKKFFDYVDKNWKGDGEKKEEVEEEHGAGEEGTDELLDTYKNETPGQTHMRWAGSQTFQKEESVFSVEELSHFEEIMELSDDEE